MKSKIILSVFALFLFSASCGESTACKDLVWEAPESNQVVGLRISAGNKCENYNDYYEGDLNKIIKQIQSMKIVLNRKCTEVIEGNDPEEVEVDCPEFVPETIEFGELTSCSFGTPPAENNNCMADPLRLSFESGIFSGKISWTFQIVSDLEFYYENSNNINGFGTYLDNKSMSGHFKDENLTIAEIVFTWTEGTEEKTLEFSATVETKE